VFSFKNLSSQKYPQQNCDLLGCADALGTLNPDALGTLNPVAISGGGYFDCLRHNLGLIMEEKKIANTAKKLSLSGLNSPLSLTLEIDLDLHNETIRPSSLSTISYKSTRPTNISFSNYKSHKKIFF